MLVTFQTRTYADITMFGDIAIRLLHLMGHSGTVPSAVEPEDIPEALKRLRAGLADEEVAEAADHTATVGDDDDEPIVSLRTRALPLIELLEAAERDQVPVLWQ